MILVYFINEKWVDYTSATVLKVLVEFWIAINKFIFIRVLELLKDVIKFSWLALHWNWLILRDNLVELMIS